MGNAFVFIILAVIAVSAALMMLTSRNAVHSALWLVLNFATVAVFYIVLNAPFIAMVQITVYAGAIVVLFLFVIMLLGAEKLGGVDSTMGGQFWTAIVLSGALFVSLITALATSDDGATAPAFDSSPEAIGQTLFESFVFPFELTSILLLVAMISLVVWHAQRRKK